MEEIKEDKVLALRMYFFVPYNVSPIQQAIQAGHAALEYADKYGQTELFQEFVREHKTWIILNGGTTNDRRDFDGIPTGTLNKIGDALHEKDVPFSFFCEPDLNDALTAICFIADERVFNREDYPDFVDWLIGTMDCLEDDVRSIKKLTTEELVETYSEEYKEWIRFLGGVRNVYLRELIRDKKLA